MEEAMQKASPEKSPTDDAKGARTAFAPAPPESNPAGLQEHISGMADREGKYLTFSLAGEEYGIGILKIKEIIGMMPITSVPQTPKFVKGVINLRGKVIPVVDLRLRFAMDAMDYNERTCIIVVEIGGGGTDIVIGIVVDSVSEVLNIKNEDIEDTPTFGTTLNTDYILGMAKMEGKVKILLDIDAVLSQDDLDMLQRAA
jgi:purine-binding chemotaxis protein CheW